MRNRYRLQASNSTTVTMHKAKSNKAFSLIELVIVVVIIGVIGAIAIPRLSRGATGADESALKGNLSRLRSAIDLYAAEHQGAYPGYHKSDGSMDGNGDEDDFYAQLLGYTSDSGEVGGPGGVYIYGTYLRSIPSLNIGKNASEDADEVKFKTEVPLQEHEGDKTGWIYNPENGEIIANSKDTDSEGVPLTDY